MGDGIIIYNDNNNVQIDSTYKNMCFHSKMFKNTTYSIRGKPVWDLAVNQNHVYVIVPKAGTLVGIAPFAKSDTQPYYHIFGPAHIITYSDDQSDLSINSGVQVYNNAGQIVFNSNKVQLKIIDYLFGHLGDLSQDIRVSIDILLQKKTYIGHNNLGVLIGLSPVGLNWYKFMQRFSGLHFAIDGNTVECRYKQLVAGDTGSRLNDFHSYKVSDMYSYCVVDIEGIDL